MSDSDSDVPALVPSSDDEDVIVHVIKTNAECVDIWLSKNVKFLEKQEHNIHIFSLGPFIMGLETFISKPWLFCLCDAKLLNVNSEKTDYTKLSDEEWQNLEVIDVVTKLVVKKMRKKKFLVNTLDMVDKIEECNRGDGIDFKHSIQNATKYSHIHQAVWEKVLSLPNFRNKIHKVKFATLYVCKLCHMVITSLAREGKDIAEDFKKSLKTKCGGPEKALDYKDKGNQQYAQQKYADAVKLYTDAIKSDPFNHLCYGNRAQAFQKQDKNYEALADGRRAVLMKPDWIKGYYRYAQACYHTGKIDMAIAINRKGMRICEKTKNNDKMLSELKDQGNKLQQEKNDATSDEVIKKIINNENYSHLTDGLPEEIRNCTTVIHLETAIGIEQLSHKRHNHDAFVLLSSDDQQSSEEDTTVSHKEPKKRTADLSKKQSKDPEVEKLIPSKGQGKKSKKGGQSSKTTDKPTVSQPQVNTTMEQKVKEKIVVVQKNEKEIERYMADGSGAYLNGLGKKAVTSYQKAFDLLANHKPEEYGMDEQDLAVLEYAFGLSEISTGLYKHILDGIERLKNITETRKDSRLAVPYYGLGKAYILLNRFEEAVEPLTRCLRMANTLKLNELTWPGTDTKMEESMTNILQKQVKELLTLTKYPPPPDAVCKLHTDKVDSRAVIFFSDPDFKGFVRIMCLTSCIIEFHNNCWKDFKSKYGEKTCDKDILEKCCPTPDCMSCIVKIIIFKQDSSQKEITTEKSEHAQSKPRKPAMKIPPSSQDKIEKRKEKKELRKLRKRESREEASDLMDDIERTATAQKEEKVMLHEYEDVPVLEQTDKDVLVTLEADIAVVKKTEEFKISKKAAKKKNKKKKDKGKQVLNVEVNFGDDNEKELLGEDSVVEEESLKPAALPTEDDDKQEEHKKLHVQKVEMSRSQFDEIAKNLFLFFEDLLAAHGPLHINDAKITSMIDDFPQDAKMKITTAGGLSKFLLQSTKFAMHGEIVCMREDAHKASKISRQQSESFASKASKLKSNSDVSQFVSQKTENPWTNGSKHSFKSSETKGLDDIDVIEKVTTGTGNNNKKSKRSCMDTLDDFDCLVIPFEINHVGNKTKAAEKTNEYPKIPAKKSVECSKVPEENNELQNNSVEKIVEKPKPTERSISMDMDAIDDIDLIPVARKNKKTKKKNKGMDDLDDFDWNISDSESFKESVGVSDLDSVSSREDTSKFIEREKMDLNKLDPRLEKPEAKMEFSISRSSSKSDISERSDLSAELKTGKQKMMELKPQPNSKSMWPSRERTINSSPNTFGPIGSPVPLDKFENKNEQSETFPSYSSYSNDKNGSLLLMDTQKAAEREKFRIDSQYVQELSDQVMKDMTLGKNLTDSERKDLQRQVTHDIWTDFKRTSKKSDQWTPKSNDTGYEYTTNIKSHTEQYMKNFYQKKNTDPTLNPESFVVVTCNNLFYGDFSNNTLTSNSGWPKSVSESLTYPGFQSSFTPSQSLFGSVTSTMSSFGSNVSSFASMSTPESAFASMSSPESAFASMSSPVSSFSSMNAPVSSFAQVNPTTSSFTQMTSQPEYQSPFSITTTKSDLFGNWSIGISVTQTSSNSTTSSQPLNTFPRNYTSSVFSNPFQTFRMEKSVHAVVETCSVSINTEPYEPLKEEFQRMKKEYELLQLDLTSALTQKQEIGHKCQVLEMEIGLKNETFGKERQSMEEKYDMLYLEWNHINQQLAHLVENEKELKSKIIKLEEEKQEVLKQNSKERQELKYVEDGMKKRQEEYKTIYDKERDRATKAEIEVLNLKKQAAMAMLERSQKEAMYHVHHLKGLHKKHQEQGKEAPAHMTQALSFYDSIVTKCSETIPKLMSDFDEQIMHVQNGKKLSELPPVFVPPPPPAFPPNSPGPEVKSLTEDNTMKLSKSSPVEPSPIKSSSGIASGLAPISVKGPISQTPLSVSTPPRPLLPPPGLQMQSFRQQIPRLATATNGQHTPKNSFEKLLQRLITTFPQYNRSIFTQLIQQLRQSRGGSLSGLTIDEITQQVTAMVQAHELKQGKNQTSTSVATTNPTFPGPVPSKLMTPPPGLSSSWGFLETPSISSKEEEVFEEEQDPCVICHEEMTLDTTVKLECHHRFHDECIRKWLKENSTCPNCRIYALLPDEFPTLM